MIYGDAAQGDAGLISPGQKEADGPAFGGTMRSEDGKRVGVAPGDDGINAAHLIGIARRLGRIGHRLCCARSIEPDRRMAVTRNNDFRGLRGEIKRESPGECSGGGSYVIEPGREACS